MHFVLAPLFPCLVHSPMLLCYCINLIIINKEINTLNQEEEIMFSLKKFKRVFCTYWYIVLITFILGIACVGIMTKKAMSQPSIKTQASNSTMLMAPSGTNYFTASRTIKVDWNNIYPDYPDIQTTGNSNEVYSSILAMTSNQLEECHSIINLDSFRNDINSALSSANYVSLRGTDYITYYSYGNDVFQLTVYGQCSVERIQCILNASADSLITIGQKLFNLGKCSTIETSDVYVCTYGNWNSQNVTLQTIVPFSITAKDWIMSELAKSSPSAVLANDALVPHQIQHTITNDDFKSSLMSRKNLAIMLVSIFLGLLILFCIAVFDHIVDIPEEVSFLRLDKIGECMGTDYASASVISERINLIAKNNGYNKLPVISTIPARYKHSKDLHQLLDTICTSASDDSLSLTNFNYPDGYMANLSDINGSDGVIIAIKSGKVKRSTIKQLLENLKVDNADVIGYIWVK